MQGGTDKPNCPRQKADIIFSVILAQVTGWHTVESQKLRVAGLYPPKDITENHWFL